ncbi:MAG: AAA family ATPase [Candidatus Thermoplasmatota archaeon]|nr:AAA family ATPase [Candidatus Thermoplasmatota archaeon]
MKDSITIGGLPGSGTTTVAKILKKKLALPYVYAGDMFREMAGEYSMTLAKFGAYCEQHPEIDVELDKKQEVILMAGHVILEGRLAGWIAYRNDIPSFKIWLDCSEDERVRRVMNREGGEFKRVLQEIKEREKSEKKRYKNFYGIDISDTSIYDIVIDTTNIPPEKVAEEIIEKLRKEAKKV